jgi:hypothetical protein
MRMPVSFTSLNLVEPEDQIMVSIGLGNMQLLPGELYSDIYLDGFLPQKGTPLLPIALFICSSSSGTKMYCCRFVF